MYFSLCLFLIRVILYTTLLSHYANGTCQTTIGSNLIKNNNKKIIDRLTMQVCLVRLWYDSGVIALLLINT
jgi:hypothetical protein